MVYTASIFSKTPASTCLNQRTTLQQVDLEFTLIKMNNMEFEIDPKTYEKIAQVIHSDQSPVGIDAKKTHILILNKLQELNDRIERMEKLIKNGGTGSNKV
jgi:hypothetical protein